MKAKSEIDAGVCGFHTTARVHSEDDQNVTFDVETDWEKIRRLAVCLKDKGPLDVYQEINPASSSLLMEYARAARCSLLRGLRRAGRPVHGHAGRCRTGPSQEHSHSNNPVVRRVILLEM